MKILVIDIETAPLPLTGSQEDWLCRIHSECDYKEAIAKASLSPLTGQIVCIGMLNPISGGAVVKTQGGGLVIHTPSETTFDPLKSIDNHDWTPSPAREQDVLSVFWTHVKAYDLIVTFNGRGFDLPFLIMRSKILGVTPTRTDLMGYRFADKPHYDLLDQMTHYGATKRFPLSIACEAFGIQSPKTDCHGGKVAEYFAAGRHREIAEYCLGDVWATAELWKKWTGK